MDQKCTNYIKFYYNKDSDENLAWLTQKTEDPKSNKGTQFSEDPTPPPLIRGGGGGVQLWIYKLEKKNEDGDV